MSILAGCTNMTQEHCNPGHSWSSVSSFGEGLASSDDDGACTPCAIGKASGGGTGQRACVTCAAGRYTNITKAAACSLCPPGKNLVDASDLATAHDDIERCSDCPQLTYSPVKGLGEDCFPCLTARTVGAVECAGCAPGKKKQGNEECEDCAAGRFTDKRNQQQCKACENGKYGTVAGMSQCTDCNRGQHGSDVAVGAATKEAGCINCPAGKYSDIDGLALASNCKACEAGFWSSDPGIEKESQCKSCIAGTYSNVGAGERTSLGACTDCDAGRYSSTTAATTFAQCISCPEGYFQKDSASLYCLPCQPGKFAESEASPACDDCAVQTFANATGARVCHNCPPGSVASTGAAACLECAPGKFGENCKSCPVGWKRGDEDTELDKCKQCSKGFTSTEGAKSCDSCLLGMFGKARGKCDACQQGRYKDARDPTPCVKCPSSRYSSKKRATSQAECLPCPADRTTGNKTGASEFKDCLCLDGSKYQHNDTDVECSDCPKGAICPVKGSRIFDLYAQNSYWQAMNVTHKFNDCGMAFSDQKKAAAARANCCPDTAGCDKVPRSSDWTTDQQCAVGYSGPLCVACAENFVFFNSECIACDGGSPLWVGIAGLCGVGFVVFLVTLIILKQTIPHGLDKHLVETKKERIGGLLVIIVSFLQILSAFTVTYSVAWPEMFATFSQGSGALVNLEIMSVLAIGNCQLAVPFINKFLLQIATPPVSTKFFCCWLFGVAKRSTAV